MRLALCLFVLLLPAVAEPAQLVFPTMFGDYILTLDPARLSEGEMRQLVVLSPHLSGWTSLAVVPRLETCVAGDPAYLDCDARAPTSAAFLLNARANVAKGARALAALRALRHPRELSPVAAYLTRSLAFSLWLEETRLAYYESWDDRLLARAYEGVEPARACAVNLQALATARSKDDKHAVASLGWHNCVNNAVRRSLGPYPLAAWEAFLATYGIRERHVERGPDDRPATR